MSGPLNRYRVSLDRAIGDRPRNPFVASIPRDGVTVQSSVRTFVMEARGEKHVRQLLKEAQDVRHPNVIGYQLRRIERVPQCCATPCEIRICKVLSEGGMCFAAEALQTRRINP